MYFKENLIHVHSIARKPTVVWNLQSLENSVKNSLDWNRIMDEIDASQLIHLGDQLTTTRAEVLEMGHPIDELLVSVSSLPSTYQLE